MTSETKSISISLDAETEQLLKETAARKGISAAQYCADAVFNELNREIPDQKFSAKGMIAAGEAVFRGKLSVTDSADLIREAREERHRNL